MLQAPAGSPSDVWQQLQTSLQEGCTQPHVALAAARMAVTIMEYGRRVAVWVVNCLVQAKHGALQRLLSGWLECPGQSQVIRQ